MTVSHWNKFLKGALVGHLLAHPRTMPDDLRGWEHPSGFRYERELDELRGDLHVLSLVRRD